MEKVKLQPRYYTVKQIQQLECCGREKAYQLAKELPHERRGTQYFVFSEDYERYYEEKREKLIDNIYNSNNDDYRMKKFM